VALIALGSQDSGETMPAALGDIVSVALAETAMSGFRWDVDHVDDHVLRPAGDTAAPIAADDRGAPGERIFEFEVVGPGLGDLALKRWRDWEGDASVVERFVVTIDARTVGGG
jgi:inhibitor of cysteine peptidase